jgi:hypothetical protein
VRESQNHVYEGRPRIDHRGVNLISNALPFGRLWYGESNAVKNAIGYAQHYRRSHDAVIRVYDAAGDVIETHEHKDERSGLWMHIAATESVTLCVRMKS